MGRPDFKSGEGRETALGGFDSCLLRQFSLVTCLNKFDKFTFNFYPTLTFTPLLLIANLGYPWIVVDDLSHQQAGWIVS